MSKPGHHQAVNPQTDGATAPRRRPIAVFTTYADAERAVDRLSDLGFPVDRVAIIGHDLRTVEQVTGRLNYGGAALKGAVSGACIDLGTTNSVIAAWEGGQADVIPNAEALLGLYLRTPGMRQEESLGPTQQGIPLAKDVWLAGIGASLLIDGLVT